MHKLVTGRSYDQNGVPFGVRHTDGRMETDQYVWDTDTLSWVAEQQSVLSTDSLTVSGTVSNFPGLVPFQYDDVTLSYTGSSLTGVTFKSGGSTVATVALTYTDGSLTGVARS